jgi:hypothetical protein
MRGSPRVDAIERLQATAPLYGTRDDCGKGDILCNPSLNRIYRVLMPIFDDDI